MISSHVNKFCKEDPSMIENYYKAIADETQTWHCHHRDEIRTLPSGMVVIRSKEELIENGRYYHCPANELIFLRHADHSKLHHTGYNMGTNNKGQIRSEFAIKFNEHYGMVTEDNAKLYTREKSWYYAHSCKCRWEVNK